MCEINREWPIAWTLWKRLFLSQARIQLFYGVNQNRIHPLVCYTLFSLKMKKKFFSLRAVIVFLALSIPLMQCCLNNGSSFRCRYGAVIETYGGTSTSDCAFTVDPLICRGNNCELVNSSGTIQIYINGRVLGGCAPFLISSRQCRGFCLTPEGNIASGTFMCESSSYGEQVCPSCAAACVSYN